jgi:hypothetical protein
MEMPESEVESNDPWEGESNKHIPHHPEAPDVVAQEPAGAVGRHADVAGRDGGNAAQRGDAPDQIVVPDDVLLLFSAVMERENCRTYQESKAGGGGKAYKR